MLMLLNAFHLSQPYVTRRRFSGSSSSSQPCRDLEVFLAFFAASIDISTSSPRPPEKAPQHSMISSLRNDHHDDTHDSVSHHNLRSFSGLYVLVDWQLCSD